MQSLANDVEMTLAEDLMLNRNTGDRNLYVKFYIEAVENKTKSIEAGHPVFEDLEMCEIRVPGDKDTTVKGPASMYANRFRSRYEAWKKGFDVDSVSGMPLREWPMIKASQAEQLSCFGVRTVEQLAAVPDVHLSGLGPGYIDLRKKAQFYLESSRGNVELEKMRLAIEERDAQIKVLERAIAEQNERIEEIRKGSKKG